MNEISNWIMAITHSVCIFKDKDYNAYDTTVAELWEVFLRRRD